ncbi:ATP-binding cassette domain-containing protein [Actinomyces sp.]|uniref:ATP-binding cassette domain-containing protein n=1 Tax=Actinomyces sp. TaxID=29317 RepID=UPI0026DD89C4|nr:ATP-binding cassette domain-containing protein [Actinomyces sp.]MDO4900482.1 ATP-binding cassette domain-containing protein [Actinomyces sp.]
MNKNVKDSAAGRREMPEAARRAGPRLRVVDGSFRYPGAKAPILNHISTDVDDRQLLAVLGPNGAGKTTLLRTMLGLQRWTTGVTYFDGVELSTLADMPCRTTSGGQFQMILIARALVAKPQVLVLDEPETGLDFRNQLIVLNLLRSLVTERSLNIVMNTHYPAHALGIADQVLLLDRDSQGTLMTCARGDG